MITYLVLQNNYTKEVSSRLALVEEKLGGTEKLNCNEAESIKKIKQSVVRIVGGEAEGSGFVIKPDGLIITNFHVIEFEPSPKVVLPDNTFEIAEIVMVDRNADLAIIKIDKDMPAISWGEDYALNIAEELLVVGFPLGGDIVGEASVSKGSLSARRRSKDVGVEYLQTDATLNPGVSGGPMINVCGEVVGINTAGMAGLGMAISADSIKQKWLEMASSDDPLGDIQRIEFKPNESPLEAVKAFYNYLKARKLNKAFPLLSDNFVNGVSYESWVQGYGPMLDTSVIRIEEDEKIENRINVKLATKDFVDDEIVYKYFEGYWDVKEVEDQWLLWDPEIKEIEYPDYAWFYI